MIIDCIDEKCICVDIEGIELIVYYEDEVKVGDKL